ncbi:MAG: hypothetical protein CL581_01920 [Alteromonadaceae bacterium]|uniref:hypothetical protein n=1 Tax=Marinobacter sp. BGYM27 TaxID=2975597 RepID=UPI000C4B8AAD|nr:hypothetical protein [Marinobacter sp. BGYM27]MAA63524.1 hypothetical protein [Alteromonadaceae bacterium]MBH86476.1 hypothetical protein [Alteromonadaceae bacterium]MDG5500655.1 hypothetical protein [Marinobacter sp. BGYM27]|tara:strand:- start:7111 stop:7614 length:504 start_codon:yes stop_codon:yes gene_type:complete
MFWNFVATVFCGLGAAGIAFGIRAITRKKAPKWIIPVFAGLGMMGFLVQGEYTWFDLKQSQLPEGSVVVSKEESRIIWRPWSLFVPQVTSFTVLDTDNISQEPGDGHVVSFYLYRFEKSYVDSVSDKVYLLNCDNLQLVPLDENRKASMKQLRQLSKDDPLLKAACG